MLWLLLKNKLLMTYNDFLKGEKKKKRRKLLAIAAGIFLFIVLFQWIFQVFYVIFNHHEQGAIIVNNILSVFFFGFFVFLFVSGITLSIHNLFISNDLPLLLSFPFNTTTIFSYKIIETIFANSTFFLFLGTPIFIAYGVVTHATWYYYPVTMVIVLIFMALPISISFLLAILIVRILPAVRAKEIMVGLLGLVSFGIWMALQIFRVSQFDSHSHDFDAQQIESITQFVQSNAMSFLPSTWTANSLVAFSTNTGKLILTQTLPLVLVSVAIYLIALKLAENLYRQGIIGSQFEVSRKKKKSNNSVIKKTWQFLPHRLSNSVEGSVFLRDIKLLARDLRQLTNILLLIFMMTVFPLIQGRDTIDSSFGEYLPFTFIIFFSAMAASQLTSRIIPIEGKSFWIVMLTPQKISKIWVGKLLVGYLFNLLSVWLAVLVSSIYFQISFRIYIMAFIVTSFTSLSFSVFGLTLGSIMPKFDWEHPKRMLSTGGLVTLTYGSIIFAGIWVGLISIIYYITPLIISEIMIVDGIVILLCVIISCSTFIIGMNLSSKKLEKLEWNI